MPYVRLLTGFNARRLLVDDPAPILNMFPVAAGLKPGAPALKFGAPKPGLALGAAKLLLPKLGPGAAAPNAGGCAVAPTLKLKPPGFGASAPNAKTSFD